MLYLGYAAIDDDDGGWLLAGSLEPLSPSSKLREYRRQFGTVPVDHVRPLGELRRQTMHRWLIRRWILAHSRHHELLRHGQQPLAVLLQRDEVQPVLGLEGQVELVEEAQRGGALAARDLVDALVVEVDADEPQPDPQVLEVHAAEGRVLRRDDRLQLFTIDHVVIVENLREQRAVPGVVAEHVRRQIDQDP